MEVKEIKYEEEVYKSKDPLSPDKLKYLYTDLGYFNFLAFRDYLFRIYINKIKDDKIILQACWGLKSINSKIIKEVTPANSANVGFIDFEDAAVYFHLSFKQKEYMITTAFIVNMEYYDTWIYKVDIVCLDKNEANNKELLNYLLNASIQCSPIKNKIILTKDPNIKNKFLDCIEILKPKNITLNDIFLPKNISQQIKRYIAEINDYDTEKKKLNKQFRFLLSGQPGTGKSQIINAIINAVYGKITIIVINGIDIKMVDIIDFCKIFDPCLLVIDDMDFLARKRDENFNSNTLVNFLHSLDGLFPESLFLLGATNDKFLVDEAASRPGRFDMILDISKIDSDNYLDLIKREINDQSLIELFNDEVLNFLENKRVTGAFIVNLIKQLVSIKKIEGKVGLEELQSLLKFTYEGFYLEPPKLGNILGFK